MKKGLMIAMFGLCSMLTVGSMSLRSDVSAGGGRAEITQALSEYRNLDFQVPHISVLEKAQAQEAPAEEVAPPSESELKDFGDVAKLIPTMVTFAKNGQWLLFGSVLSLILTFLVRQLVLPKVNLKTGVLPLVSAVLGCLAGVGGAVLAGATPLAAVIAVLSGPAGSWLWSAVAKHFFPAAPKGVQS